MRFIMSEGVLIFNLTNVGTLMVATLMYLTGEYLRKKVPFFERFCIPGPVIGGLVFALFNFLLHMTGKIDISMDTTFQAPFMLAFFVTVGLGASLGMLKAGGKLLVIYWLLCGLMDTLQNVVGVCVAKLVGIAPIYGIMAGSVALSGGHSGAVTFGEAAEMMGHPGAIVVSTAAATFGLVAGGLFGGPVAKRLIEKNHLSSTEAEEVTYVENISSIESKNIAVPEIMKYIALITTLVTLGAMIGDFVTREFDFYLPPYVGAMFLALLFRNVGERIGFFKCNVSLSEKIGDVSLGIFLSMALIALRIWELLDLAIPLIIILTVELLFMLIFVYLLTFKCLGKSFDAAVMCAGMLGHGLGATPNAIANMSAVTSKFGMSRKAFMVVPMVGACLVDILAMPETVWFINFFGK